MSMIKYDPFRELRNLQDDMTRLFTGVMPANLNREEMTHGAWAPSVDIYEDKDRLILEAELPGMSKEDFQISVENNVITLSGERRFEKKTDGDNYHRVERAYGTFTRSFTLPQTVTPDGATAEFNDGVLRVALPKREETKARQIEITGTGSEARKIQPEGESKTASA